MKSFTLRFLGPAAIILLVVGPVGHGHAQSGLPAEIATALAEAAAVSDEVLLEAVERLVSENTALAKAIVDEATRLRPELETPIKTAAIAGGGENAVEPAAGPLLGLGPILAGAAGVGGTAAAVGAGGGGGGGGGSTGDNTVTAPAPSFETDEFNAQAGLALVNAADAYSRGLSGSGVVVAVLDSGLDTAHSEFAGRVAPGGFDFINNTSTITDLEGHGTDVAGVIAANKDDTGMHGVAYDARILPLTIIDANGAVTASDAAIAAAMDRAVANGAAVLNNSWGDVSAVTQTSRAAVSAAFPQMIGAVQRAVDAGRVFVFSTGNEFGFEPSVEAGLPYLFPEFRDLWVAVMAVDLDGNEPFYTNRCGVAAAWCIAAPGGGDAAGSGVYTTASGGGYERVSGTSFAAPHASGALALLTELFPNLTPQQIVQRLFDTADGTGIYADSSIFGHGLMDLDAATRPIGAIAVLAGPTIDGPAFDLDKTRVTLGAAFGDGLTGAFAGRELAVFDSYRATFFVDLGAFAAVADSGLDLDALLARFGGNDGRETIAVGRGSELSYALAASGARKLSALDPDEETELEVGEISLTSRLDERSSYTIAFNADPARGYGLRPGGAVEPDLMLSEGAFAAPHFGFAERGHSFALTHELAGLGTLRLGSFVGHPEDEDTGDSVGATAELALPVTERADLSLSFGMLVERGTFLGSETEGAFAVGSATPSYFAGLSGGIALTDRYSLVGSLYAGVSLPEAEADSLFADFSAIRSRSFSLGLIGRNVIRDGDRVGFVVNQPLRVTGGHATLSLTTGRDPAGNVFSSRAEAGLAPRGREIDAEAFYRMPLGGRSTVQAGAMLRREPGHVRDAGTEGVLLFKIKHAF